MRYTGKATSRARTASCSSWRVRSRWWRRRSHTSTSRAVSRVDVGGQQLVDRQLAGGAHHGRHVGVGAREPAVALGDGRLAGRVDEQPADHVQAVVAGRAGDRPRRRQLLARRQDLLDDGPRAARGPGQAVGVLLGVARARRGGRPATRPPRPRPPSAGSARACRRTPRGPRPAGRPACRCRRSAGSRARARPCASRRCGSSAARAGASSASTSAFRSASGGVDRGRRGRAARRAAGRAGGAGPAASRWRSATAAGSVRRRLAAGAGRRAATKSRSSSPARAAASASSPASDRGATGSTWSK